MYLHNAFYIIDAEPPTITDLNLNDNGRHVIMMQ